MKRFSILMYFFFRKLMSYLVKIFSNFFLLLFINFYFWFWFANSFNQIFFWFVFIWFQCLIFLFSAINLSSSSNRIIMFILTHRNVFFLFMAKNFFSYNYENFFNNNKNVLKIIQFTSLYILYAIALILCKFKNLPWDTMPRFLALVTEEWLYIEDRGSVKNSNLNGLFMASYWFWISIF